MIRCCCSSSECWAVAVLLSSHWAAEASSMHHGTMPTSFSTNFMLPLMKLVSAKFDMRNEVRFNAERSRSPGGWYSDAFAP